MNELQRFYTATSGDELEFRAEIDEKTGERKIIGYASLYNSPSKPFTVVRNGVNETATERIDPGAFADADFSDCIFNVEHNDSQVVGRIGKNLTISQNGKGIFFQLLLGDEAKSTTDQNDLVKNVQQGILRACSFAAKISDSGLDRTETGQLVHVIRKFSRVADLTATVSPAYPETWITKRSFDNMEVSGDVKTEESKPVEHNEIEKMTIDFEFIQLQ